MAESAFAVAARRVRAGELDADAAAAQLHDQLTPAERLWLLDGDTPFWRGLARMARAYNTVPIVAGAIDRLGIPGLRFCDGPRGVVMGASTAFPAVIARAATWDPALEERIGRAIGAEARAQGANLFGGVVANLARHPAWGRTQESYGEDPLLIGTMASALTRGARTHVMACVKHFALNSIEDARFTVDVRVGERDLHEHYLRAFRMVVAAGADAVGTSYNYVNGIPAGQSRPLLTEVLRERWGFRGFVMTDFMWGLRDPVASLDAGQDLEMPFRQQRARVLPGSSVDPAAVQRSGRRLLRAQLAHAASLGPPPEPAVVACDEHRALAREAAAQSVVLLRNEGALLPLATDERLAVLGPLAAAPNLGDAGSSAVRPPSSVSILDGLREAFADVVHHDGADLPAAVAAAATARTAVVVVGMRDGDEGEGIVISDPRTLALAGPPFNRPRIARATGWLLGTLWPRIYPGGGDRRSLRLRPEDEALIEAVASACARTVVVLVAGSAVVMERWRHQVPAILLAWYPGMEGGRALADVLTGAREPGGRLPFAIPTDERHLPPFDPDADVVEYDRWVGQRRLDRDGHPAAYPLGWGLGYTTFEVAGVRRDGDRLRVRVRNTGARAGATVVQAYRAGRVAELAGFQRVSAAAGAEAEALVALDGEPGELRVALHA